MTLIATILLTYGDYLYPEVLQNLEWWQGFILIGFWMIALLGDLNRMNS
jgi:hypothetical protein